MLFLGLRGHHFLRTQLIVAAVTHRTHTERCENAVFLLFCSPPNRICCGFIEAFIDDPSASYFFDGKQSRPDDHLPLLY